jgi:hypothetical protein
MVSLEDSGNGQIAAGNCLPAAAFESRAVCGCGQEAPQGSSWLYQQLFEEPTNRPIVEQ